MIEKADYLLSKVENLNERRVISLFFEIEEYEFNKEVDEFLDKYISSDLFYNLIIKLIKNNKEYEKFLETIEDVNIPEKHHIQIKTIKLKDKISRF